MLGSIPLSYFWLGILTLVLQSTVEGQMATGTIVWMLLAFFVLSLAIAMISGLISGGKTIISSVGGFTQRLKLDGSYYEESEDKLKSYKVMRAPLGILLIFAVGVMGGFFGMGGGWAMFFMNLGCGVGFFALVPTVLYQLIKKKDWFCDILGTILAVLYPAVHDRDTQHRGLWLWRRLFDTVSPLEGHIQVELF